MLRRNPFILKAVRRTWKKDSVGSSHMPHKMTPAKGGAAGATTGATAAASGISGSGKKLQQQVMVDPALERGSDESAKEKKRFAFINYRPQDHKQLEKMKLWWQLIRADKPVGTNLLFIPCLWGSGLAVSKAIVFHGADWLALMAPMIPMQHLMLFYWGAFHLRSAGCIINDMWDRDFDKLVERTKDRPLASGRLSMFEASAMLSVHLISGALTLVPLSPCAVQVSLMAIPLVATYPLMKRITHFPQMFLGCTMNWGVLVGYASIMNTIDWPVVLPMYLASICWTVVYDTIYAYQDRADDVKAGVKSTAVYFGNNKKAILYFVAPMFPLMCFSAMAAGQNILCGVGLGLSMIHLMMIIDHVNINDAWSCKNGFIRNVRFGLMIFFSMFAGNLLWIFIYEDDNLIAKKHDSATSNLSHYMVSTMNLDALADGKDDFNPTEFTWWDRFMKPSYVYAQLQRNNKLVAEGSTSEQMGEQGSAVITVSTEELHDVVIPAWMRREYVFQNVASMLRFGVPYILAEETVDKWERDLYAFSDHYNAVSLLSL